MIYTALSISNSSIKILSLKGRQVKKWGSITLKAGAVRDGLIIEPQAVSEAISGLFTSNGIRKEGIAVSLAGLSFTYRFIKLPRLKSALLEEAIIRAARKEMSLPLEELYLAWQLVPGKGEELTCFILGVPRQLVDAAAQTFKLAGIEPYTLELQPLALARAANRRDAIAISLEHDCYNIVFIADGIPEVIHTLSPRGEGATLEDNIRRLADELTKMAAFYQSSHQESRISSSTPLLITGDLAAETAAGGLLQTEVDYPIEPLVPPLEFPSSAPTAAYAVSSGLALNYATRKAPGRTREGFYDININTLSGKYRKARGKPVPATRIWLGIFLAIALVLIYPFYQSSQNIRNDNTNLEDELRRVNRELNLAKIAADEADLTGQNIQATVNMTLALKSANQGILGYRGVLTHDLKAVTSTQPPNIQFTSIENNRRQINVRGEADSVFTVVAYATALEKVPFRDVRIARLDEVPAISTNTESTENATGIASIIVFEIVIKK